MKKELIFFLIILIFSSFVSASVIINEFELNPPGTDAGNEWVELYNTGGPVNITGWKISDSGDSINIINDELIINASGFFLLGGPFYNFTLNNNNEVLRLLDRDNVTKDITINVSDNSNNNRTWQRIPDGNLTNWVFQNGTKGFSNTADIISPVVVNQVRSPSLVFEDDNVILNGSVIEDNLQEVMISGTWTGNWENFTVFTATANVTQRNFTYVVTKDNLESGEFVEWYYIAEDKSGNVGVGEKQNFTVRTTTVVNVNPSSPDGLNGWYVSIPLFTIVKDAQANASFYRFDSLQWNLFAGPFLFDINKTLGGIERLDFFSSFGYRNESVHNITIKVDVFDPELTKMNPIGVIKNINTNINALIDDKYQSNSGLNLNSLIMELDNNTIIPIVNSIDSLKATVNYSAVNLSEGNHTVNITIYDNAGNLGGGIWSFLVNSTTYILSVNSPLNGNYGSNKVRFDIKSNIPGRITFADNDGKENVLCKNCISVNKTLNLNEGYHNLTIKINGAEINRTIFIDSKEPRIIKIFPKSKTYVNSTILGVKYTEEFLDDIVVNYGNESLLVSSNLIGCESGKNKICDININLSLFNGQAIEFWFNVSDKITSRDSNVNILFVDTIRPVITINSPNNNQSRRVGLDLALSEKVEDLSYIDHNENRPREKRLCRNCQFYNKTKTFTEGNHSLTFIAADKAGNIGEASINFVVS